MCTIVFDKIIIFYLGYNIAQNKIKKNTYGKGCIGENRNELIDSALFFQKIQRIIVLDESFKNIDFSCRVQRGTSTRLCRFSHC